jgi:hypothetical protein
MPGDRNLLSLDASLAIPTCVLRFKDSGLRRRTPVRSVLLTGQTGTHRSDPPVRPVWHCCSIVFGSSVLALWINQGTQWFSGEPPETPRTWCSLRQSPLMTRLPRSPGSTLVLWLNQETVTMRPALDPAGHQVPRTKPTCLLHTWRPHRRRPFALVLHLH